MKFHPRVVLVGSCVGVLCAAACAMTQPAPGSPPPLPELRPTRVQAIYAPDGVLLSYTGCALPGKRIFYGNNGMAAIEDITCQ